MCITMNMDLAIPRGENVYEFNSLQDVVSSIKGDSIVNFDTNKDFADINKQNGYRVLLLKFTKDSKYFYPDIEGAYCPIFTYVSSRFKDTKGMENFPSESSPYLLWLSARAFSAKSTALFTSSLTV